MLDQIRKVKREEFDQTIDENFTIVLLDGTTVDLVKNGALQKVTYDNRMEYIELATQKLLHVAD